MSGAATSDGASTRQVIDLLGRLRRLGVDVWAEKGRLRYRAPAGRLGDDIRAELVRHKPSLLAFLAGAAVAGDGPPPLEHSPRSGPLELSFAQQRFWFLDQAAPGDATFNLPYAVRLRGQLDRRALQRAIDDVLAQHAALRATFPVVDGEPSQLIAAHVTVGLALVDLSTAAEPDAARRERELIDDEFQRCFDLARGPLVRVALIRRAADEHVLLFTCHHIVFDGWSWGVLRRDLRACYAAAVTGAAPPAAAGAIDYADYVGWQRSSLRGPFLERQLSYWRHQLAGAPLALDLPSDRPRPAVQTSRGDVVPVDLPPAQSAALVELGRAEGATLFMVLLAAFQVLLGRYSGRRDLLVGTPVAGRTVPELEPLVGLFVNMLVLRGDLSGRPSFRELLARVRRTTLEAHAHQHLPFDRLVEDLQPDRDPSRTPVFQAMLALQNLPTVEDELAGVALEPIFGPAGVAKYDVSLVLEERAGGVCGALEYNSDLFDRETAERMVGHFHVLLGAVAGDPDAPVDAIALMEPAERHRLLTDFNATAAPAPREACLHDLIAAVAGASPEAVAVTCEDASLTYGDLEARANALARHLQALGVGPETVVALSMQRSPAMLVGLLGILKAGGAYLPLDPELPAQRVRFMLEDARASVLLTEAALLDEQPPFPGPVVCLDRDRLVIAEHPGSAPPTAVTPDHLAYVIYTSGSTGRPKGVQVAHRAVVNYLTDMARRPGMAAADRVLAVTTLSFDLSVLEVFLPLTVGARLVIASRTVARDGTLLARRLAQGDVTSLVATPSTWRMLLDAGWEGDRQLCAWTGGEALPADLACELVRRAGEVWNLYGPTETTVFSTVERVEGAPASVTVGRPLANTQVYVLDERAQPVPVGVPGEICIAGDGVARGYRDRASLTAERFVPDPFGDARGARMYRTGDLGRHLRDGRIECLGRIDNQVKLRGHRIESGEVEARLAEHPDVRQAVVTVRPDAAGDPHLVAYVVAAGSRAPTAPELREHLHRALPGYMVPSAFVSMAELPMTPNGKVDRRALPTPGAPRVPAQADVQPQTATEERVAAVWADVLGIAAVGPDDNFFDLGGESMKAVRAARRIGPDLAVLDLFTHPTVRALAAHLDRVSGAPTAGHEADAGLLHRLGDRRSDEASTTLVCVPFGGGSAISYQELARAVPQDWAVYAVELPGHDYARRDEPLLGVEELALRCAEEILARLPGDIVLYGHCVGSALAVAIAQALERAGREVRGVVVGAGFPTTRLPGPLDRLARLSAARRMSDRAVQDSLRVLGGLSEALPDDERRVLARNVRHDARAGEAFYTEAFAEPDAQKLRAGLLCVVGGRDRITDFAEERVHEWETFSDRVDLAVVAGAEHFFNKLQARELAALIAGQVARWRAGHQPRAISPPSAVADRSRLSSFLILALGQLVSMIGTGLTTFALGVWAYQRTGSLTAFATITTLGLVPAILAAPFAGAAADRLNRRRIMIACDVAGLILAGAVVALLAADALEIWHLYVVVGVSSATGALRQPAYLAGATQLVPKRYLGHANGLLALGTAGGIVFAQLLGGGVMVLAGLQGALLIDVASYGCALATLLIIRVPDLMFARREESFRREIVNGWRYVLARRPLVALTVFFAMANALAGVVVVLVTPLMLTTASAATLGAVLAAQGVGMLAGGLLMALWGGARRRAIGMVASVGLFGVASLAIGMRPTPALVAIGMFGIGVCAALINAHWLALVQVKVPPEMHGRVLSTCLMLARIVIPGAYLGVAPLVDGLVKPALARPGALHDLAAGLGASDDVRAMALVLGLTGIAAIALTAAGYASASLRRADETLPDAVAAAADATPSPSVPSPPALQPGVVPIP